MDDGLTAAIEKALTTLGLSALKPKQLEAVTSFVEGNDTLVILPTGHGKSVIYAILPLVFDHLSGLFLIVKFINETVFNTQR